MTPNQRHTLHQSFLRWHAGQERYAKRVTLVRLRAMALAVIAQVRAGSEWEESVSPEAHAALLADIYGEVGMQSAIREYSRLLSVKSAPVLMLTKDRDGPGLSEPASDPGLLTIQRSSPTWRQRMMLLARSSESAQRVTQMSAHTKQLIRDVLTRGAEQVWDIRKIARRLREVIADPVRALLIVRTETTRAASVGAEMGASATNLILNKVWIATNDARTRASHRAMLRSKPVPKDGVFIVGGKAMRYPGDPAGGPAQVCRCRCSVVYVPSVNLFDN
ncbi:phage minor head protein [Spirosoma sp. 209]|uniref:phage minor head protein n=1 Tax=Spirosoma sp. 209 TaxID=1955701 RepID=UPI00098D24B2|nr:phage minor head protein [Spirosoma sp. 209]